jgi:hypothetical protein
VGETLFASSIGDMAAYTDTTKANVWSDVWVAGLVLAFVVVVSPARIAHHNIVDEDSMEEPPQWEFGLVFSLGRTFIRGGGF